MVDSGSFMKNNSYVLHIYIYRLLINVLFFVHDHRPIYRRIYNYINIYREKRLLGQYILYLDVRKLVDVLELNTNMILQYVYSLQQILIFFNM